MRKLILALAVALLAAAPPRMVQAQEPTPSAPAKATKYTCMMHPEVVSDKPGKCPKCGMELVPVKQTSKRPTPNAKHPTSNSQKHAMGGMQDMHDQSDHQMARGTHDHQMASGGMGGMKMPEHQMSMQSSISIADPMSRESSGTSLVSTL